MTHDGSESSTKNTAPRWFEKQKKILGFKGGSWKSKKVETIVYQSNLPTYSMVEQPLKSFDRFESFFIEFNFSYTYFLHYYLLFGLASQLDSN